MQREGSWQRGTDLEMWFFSLVTCCWVLCWGCCVVLKCIKVRLSGTFKVLFRHFSWPCNGRLVGSSRVQRCGDVAMQVSPRKWLFSGAPAVATVVGAPSPSPCLNLGKPCSFPGVKSCERGAGGGWNLLWCFCQKWGIGPKRGKAPVQPPLQGKLACLGAVSGGSQINL